MNDVTLIGVSVLVKAPDELKKLIKKLMDTPDSPQWEGIESIMIANPFSLWLFQQGRQVFGNI